MVDDQIEKPVIETVEISEDGKFGRFVVEPLERGYGTTLGKLSTSYSIIIITRCRNYEYSN